MIIDVGMNALSFCLNCCAYSTLFALLRSPVCKANLPWG